MMEKFDYIIAGTGCAGLMLAYYLNKSVLNDRKILLIDQKIQKNHDKNWSFWERDKSEFEHLVLKKWNHLALAYQQEKLSIHLRNYHYKMIKSGDYYRFMYESLKPNKNITWREEKIRNIEENGSGALVNTNKNTYHGDFVFNSLTPDIEKIKQSDYVLYYQHFRGWVIETSKDQFDEDVAMLMDFRVRQHDDTRFCYVMPQNKRKALVEFTVFSPGLLDTKTYKDELKNYISTHVQCFNYNIVEKEFGVIPMTNYPLKEYVSPHVMNTGTPGGMVKPSSGYAFKRIQEEAQAIVKELQKSGTPFYPKPWHKKRHILYDTTMLNVLKRKKIARSKIYFNLFKKNHVERVLRFLDEKSTFYDELRVFLTVPVFVFLYEMIQSGWQLMFNTKERIER